MNHNFIKINDVFNIMNQYKCSDKYRKQLNIICNQSLTSNCEHGIPFDKLTKAIKRVNRLDEHTELDSTNQENCINNWKANNKSIDECKILLVAFDDNSNNQQLGLRFNDLYFVYELTTYLKVANEIELNNLNKYFDFKLVNDECVDVYFHDLDYAKNLNRKIQRNLIINLSMNLENSIFDTSFCERKI